MTDNVVPTATKGAAAAKSMDDAINKTTKDIDHQNISYIKAVAAMGAFKHGINSVVNGLEGLGIISKENNKAIYQMTEALNIFVGVAMLLKGVIGIVNMLRNSEIALAVVETYRKVLNNPAAAAAAIAGVGIAAGIAGYLYGASTAGGGESGPSKTTGSTTITQNVYFSGGPDYSAKYTSRAAMEGVA